MPQGLSYLCLAGWAVATRAALWDIGLSGEQNGRAALWGGLTGIGTGPHAHAPPLLILSVGIPLIAVLVELNFRGFILGRLLVLFRRVPAGQVLAIGLSALVFSFDPFMTGVFRVYHWLALSNGLVWGWLFYATRNLVTTVTAHAVEVMLVYSVLTFWYA